MPPGPFTTCRPTHRHTASLGGQQTGRFPPLDDPTSEPADALIGPAGATSVLGAVHTPSGSIAAFTGEVTATSNAACPPDAFSIALDPTGPADARVLITLRGDAPGACEGVRLDWRLSAR